MKYQTSELTGEFLDKAVAAVLFGDEAQMMLEVLSSGIGADGFSPSLNWAHGGPIIERERISIFADHGTDWLAAMPEHRLGEWGTWTYSTTGATALEAAMRAFVFAKMGADVDL